MFYTNMKKKTLKMHIKDIQSHLNATESLVEPVFWPSHNAWEKRCVTPQKTAAKTTTFTLTIRKLKNVTKL